MRDLNISFGERSPAKRQSNDGAHAGRQPVAPAQTQEEVQIAPARARTQMRVEIAPKRAVPWSMVRATTPLALPVGKQQRPNLQIAQEQSQISLTGATDWQEATDQLPFAGVTPALTSAEQVVPMPPVVVTRSEPMIAPTAATTHVESAFVTPVVEVIESTAVAGIAEGALAQHALELEAVAGRAAVAEGAEVAPPIQHIPTPIVVAGSEEAKAGVDDADAVVAADKVETAGEADAVASAKVAVADTETAGEADVAAGAEAAAGKADADAGAEVAAVAQSADEMPPRSIADKIPLVVANADEAPAAAARATDFEDLPVDTIAVADVNGMLAAVVASLEETPSDSIADVDKMFAEVVASLEEMTDGRGAGLPEATAPAKPVTPAKTDAPIKSAPPAKPAPPAKAVAPPATPRAVASTYQMPVTTIDDLDFPRGPKTVPSPPPRPKKRARVDKTHAKGTSAANADKQRGAHSKKERRTGTAQYIFVALRDLAIVLVLFIVLLQFFSPTVVREHSMEDTLVSNDILFVANKAYWFGSPEYGEIVLFHTTLTTESGDEKTLVKRLIGLPGDRISINGGIVFRNGEPLDEPYLKDGITVGTMSEVVVPEDSYFVMGDNRAISRDSRDSSVGFVPADQLRGKIILRIFPLDQFRTF